MNLRLPPRAWWRPLAPTNASGIVPDHFVALIREAIHGAGRRCLAELYVPSPGFPYHLGTNPYTLKTFWCAVSEHRDGHRSSSEVPGRVRGREERVVEISPGLDDIWQGKMVIGRDEDGRMIPGGGRGKATPPPSIYMSEVWTRAILRARIRRPPAPAHRGNGLPKTGRRFRRHSR